MSIFYESKLAFVQKRPLLKELLNGLKDSDYIRLDLTEEESELFLYMLEKREETSKSNFVR